MENYYYEEYVLSNREKALKPRLGGFYCGGCDRNIILNGEKCQVCGYIEYVNHKTKKRRFKK